MKPLTARSILLILFLAAVSFLVISPVTHTYFVQSLRAADSAYAAFDDFPLMQAKSSAAFVLGNMFLLLMLFYWIRKSRPDITVRYYVVLGCGLVGMIWAPLSCLIMWAILLLLWYPWQDETVPRRSQLFFMVLICALALILRFEKLVNVIGVPLQPDAYGFVEYPARMKWLYDTGHREPLWTWVTAGVTSIFPLTENVREAGYVPIRVLTIILSVGIIPLVYLVGKRLFNHRVAFLSAALVAVNKALIYRSLQGLRLEILTIVMLMLIACVIYRADQWQKGYREVLVVGVLSGVLLLVRTSCLPFIAGILFILWLKQRAAVHKYVLGFILAAAFLVPHFIHCYQTYGDAFYSGSLHMSRYYAMTLTDTYSSVVDKVTLGELLFKIYPWYTSLGYIVLGTIETLFGTFALRVWYVPFSVVFIGASLIGYIRMALMRRTRFLLFLLFLMLFPMALPIGMLTFSKIVFDWRLIAHLFPFMAYAGSCGLFYLLDAATERTNTF